MKQTTRILWFTNTPSLASRKLGNSTYLGGWISSLEKEISNLPEIHLGVAFPYGDSAHDDFFIDSTRYFPIPQPKIKGKINGILDRWTHRIEPVSEVSYYKEIITKFQPDLIHIFGSEKSYGMVAYECRIPLIIQIQGNLSAYTEKWFSGLSVVDVIRYCKKKDFLLGYGLFHGYFLFKKRAVRERKLFRRCKYIIGRTNWDRRVSRILAPDSKYFHCEELLRESFYTKEWTYASRRKKILISTLSPLIYKGLETVLKSAWLLMRQEVLDFEWHIIGVHGREEVVAVTEGATGKKFSENNIKFMGSLDPDRLINCLMTSDCYIHPSHIENSPNSICEAMMVGIPVVATYAGGTPSMINDGLDGVLVQDGDPYAMAGAILELVSSPEQMKFFSENSRKRALVRHDPKRVINTVLAIYQNVLEAN